MLDHVNWYLVELDRRLRGKRTCHAAADFIRETRSHLDERVDELVSMGMDRSAAAKAAITDFGDPSTVAMGFWRRPEVPKWMIYGALGFAVLCTWMSLPGLIAFSNGVIGAVDFRLFPSLIPIPTLGLAVCLIVSWRTKRWLTVPFSLLILVSTLLATVPLANNTAKIETPRGARWLYLPAQQAQVQIRTDFLQRLDKYEKRVQAWQNARAKNAQRPAGVAKLGNEDKLLEALATGDRGEPDVPVRGRYGGRGDLQFLIDPMSFGARPPLLTFAAEQDNVYTLAHWPDLKSAKELWQENGAEYAAALKDAKVWVQHDISAIMNPPRTAMAERWRSLAVPAIALAVAWCFLALLANGVLIAVSETFGHLRRRAWRRQVG